MAINLFTNGAGGNTWGTAGNWSQGTVPVTGDGHVTTFDNTSPNCTVNTTGRTCDTLTFNGGTGYTNTITMTNQITVENNITFSSGMVVSGSGKLRSASVATITSNTKVWPNNFEFVNAQTRTLADNMSVAGLVSFLNSICTVNATTSETLTAAGGITVTGATVGTAKIILTGGTWSGSNTTGIANDLDLQGTITVSGSVYYRTGTLAYVSGVITTTSSTLNLTSTCTLNTNGVSWNNITLSNTTALTYTINSLLTALGTLTIGTGATTTFAGTAGFTCATLSCASTTATTINLKESVTYTITTLFSAYQSRLGSIVLFTSSHASLRANILMPNNGSNVCNVLADFRRIDASGGRSIWTYGGVITDCINVLSYTDWKSVGV